MGDKSKYEGKSKDELMKEARARGLKLSDSSSESGIREALEADDKSQQGQEAGSN